MSRRSGMANAGGHENSHLSSARAVARAVISDDDLQCGALD